MHIFRPTTIVTLQIIYYRPDYCHLLNEFLWQTPDVVPGLIRVHSFLTYWKEKIQVPIKEILVSHGGDPEWRNLEGYYKQ
jgi:uncharacterized protein Usg